MKAADSGQELSPSRRRKPSKKVIEAEEDNKVVDEVLLGKKLSEGKKSRASVDTASTTQTPEAKKVTL